MHFMRKVGPTAAILVGATFLLAGQVLLAGEQPDSSYAGSRACADCHQELADQFVHSVHSRLATFELNGQVPGCEACHGAGGKHVETNEVSDIFSFSAAVTSEVEGRCLSCHGGDVGVFWAHGEHSMNGISCVNCHTIHQSRQALPVDPGFITKIGLARGAEATVPNRASLRKPEAQLCAECHRDVAARMMLPSRHPVREGKMQCSSCHSVHGSEVGLLDTAERVNSLCTDCHTSKQGPFVFDHQPVAEGCNTCHVPHGSVADNLLKQNEPFLCLQCHEAHFHIARAGLSTPNYVASAGSDNPFGAAGWGRAFGTKCTQCHQAVHGTDLPSQTTTSQGKSLTR